MIDRDDIAAVHEAIRARVRRTPILRIDARELGLSAAPLVLKLEHLQHSGSFKVRGAFAHLARREIPQAGVVAASGGNHGAAVAYAASVAGVPARVFVPTVCSRAKIERIRRYGAELVVTGERYADAFAASEEWAASSGALAIHAYDQEETILGQGTLALELEEQAPDLETLVVAVGGGGLLAGIASWYRRRISLVAVEPEGAPTLARALEAGRPVDAEAGSIAADSLAPRRIGERVFPILKEHVARVVLVSDDEIRAAQRALWSVARIVVEPGGAAAFAAVLAGRVRGAHVGVLLCGANTDAVRFDD